MLWKRFIDDIFVIWTGSASEFHNIHKHNHTIKFTYELSETELDITLYKGDRFDRNRILDVPNHIKPTIIRPCILIPPPTTINAISKGEANRYLRTNSDKKEFQNMKQRLIDSYKEGTNTNKSYHISIPSNLTKDTRSYSRKNLKTTKKEIGLCHTFVMMHRLKQVLKKHWKLIQNNRTLNRIFPEPPVSAYRNNPSLRHKLVRAKLKRNYPSRYHTIRCQQIRTHHTIITCWIPTPYSHKISETQLNAAVMHV